MWRSNIDGNVTTVLSLLMATSEVAGIPMTMTHVTRLHCDKLISGLWSYQAVIYFLHDYLRAVYSKQAPYTLKAEILKGYIGR